MVGIMRELSLLIYGFLTAVGLEDLQKNEQCINPYGRNGTCIPLHECPEIFDISTRKNGIDLLFATKSHCGTDEEALVCCEHPGPVELTNTDINYLLGNKECGIAKEQSAVAGAARVTLGEFPWVAAIDYEHKDTKEEAWLRCAGSLINNEYVLTAAECLEHPFLNPIFVRLGELDLSTDPDCVEFIGTDKFCADLVKIVGIKETILHPFYSSSTGYHGIGLIRLEEKVTFTDFIAPICLPHSNYIGFFEEKEEFSYLVAGWTRTGEEQDGLQYVLIKRWLPPVLPENRCREHMKTMGFKQYGIDRHTFCTYSYFFQNSKYDCKQYIGGPIMKSYGNESNGVVWYIHGFPSIRLECLKEMPVSVIAVNVSHYVSWILKTVIEYSKAGL